MGGHYRSFHDNLIFKSKFPITAVRLLHSCLSDFLAHVELGYKGGSRDACALSADGRALQPALPPNHAESSHCKDLQQLGPQHNMEGIRQQTPSTDRRPTETPKNPSKIFWGFLAAALLFAIVGISVVGILGWKDSRTKSVLQVVRLTYKNQQGASVNQSAVTDRRRNTVTYRVTSRNQTSVVLFDSKYGLVCYRAAGEQACFLRRMESRDLENIQSILNVSQSKDEMVVPQNRTRYYREFLGVLGGRKVNYELVGEPVQNLCEQLPIYWVKKGEGPGRQRLIYLCIDICFPNNICVSVCFYYLPD